MTKGRLPAACGAFPLPLDDLQRRARASDLLALLDLQIQELEAVVVLVVAMPHARLQLQRLQAHGEAKLQDDLLSRSQRSLSDDHARAPEPDVDHAAEQRLAVPGIERGMDARDQ